MLLKEASTNKEKGENTLLHVFSRDGVPELIENEIKKGSDINACNNEQQTPFHLACAAGKLEVTKSLIKNGANLEIADKNGQTGVFQAVKHDHIDLLEILKNVKENLFSRVNNDHETVLHVAAREGKIDVVRFLSETAMLDVNLNNSCNYTPLSIAVERGFLDIAKILLVNGADVTVVDGKKRSLLQLALQNGHMKIAEILIDYGINVNQADSNGSTPLHIAAECKSNDLLSFMLNKNVDVNLVDDDGYSVLHIVSGAPELNMDHFRVLIDKGAKIHQQTFNGDTPLHRAAAAGNLFAVGILINHSCDLLNMKNNMGQTPSQIARENQHDDLASLLENFKHTCPVKSTTKTVLKVKRRTLTIRRE